MPTQHSGLRVQSWKGLHDIEVVEDVFNSMDATDKERDLAMRLLQRLEELGEDKIKRGSDGRSSHTG